MNKRIIMTILLVTICVCICACGNNKQKSSSESQDNTTAVSEADDESTAEEGVSNETGNASDDEEREYFFREEDKDEDEEDEEEEIENDVIDNTKKHKEKRVIDTATEMQKHLSSEEIRHSFSNEHFIYKKTRKGVLQISKETGEQRTFYQKKFWYLSYVTEHNLYYTSFRRNQTFLYCVPIVNTSTSTTNISEKPDFSKRKKIAQEKEYIWDVYVTKNYILYLADRRDVFAAVKYNKKTGHKKEFRFDSVCYEPMYAQNHKYIFCGINGEGYYCLDLKKDKLIHFSDMWANDCDPCVGAKGFFYYSTNHTSNPTIRVYDTVHNYDAHFLSFKKIRAYCKKIAKNKKDGKFKSCDLCDLFCYKETLYLQVQLNWRKGKKYHMNYVMFSIDLQNKEKELKYDEIITKLMQGNSYPKRAWRYVYNSGRILTIIDDTAFLVLNQKGRRIQQIATYDMQTGKLENVGREQAGYYLPFSVSTEPYYFGVDESTMHFMPEYFE